MTPKVVGIDVGGDRKGFHAVALQDGKFIDKKTDNKPEVIAEWCFAHKATIIAVDAPCRWSRTEKSRSAESELMNKGIWCFSTPRRESALQRSFYKWVFNGEKLYKCLESNKYLLFNGEQTEAQLCIETFPQAIACALAGQIVSAKHKARIRRDILQKYNYDISCLTSIDFVDAALCAVAGEDFRNGHYKPYGNREEGFIVVPETRNMGQNHIF